MPTDVTPPVAPERGGNHTELPKSAALADLTCRRGVGRFARAGTLVPAGEDKMPGASAVVEDRAATPAAAGWGADLLEVRDVALRFGGIVALDGVSFTMAPGLILGLIGPNGAGKTTLFNCLSRIYTPNRGDIRFEGRSLLTRPAHRIAEIGISRTFQNLALFARQSVLDNVRVGAHARRRGDFVSDMLQLPWARRQEREIETRAWELLELL